MCLLLYVSVLILLSILVNVVLCNIALSSDCLKYLLLRQFVTVFCQAQWCYCRSILVIIVLCNVALYSMYLRQLLLLCNVT